MGVTRRRFTLEFRIEAAHRVIDSDRSVAEVARDLSLVEQTLAKWVREERRRMAAAAEKGEVPLTAAERAELTRLRKLVAEQEKDLAFLGKAAAYFAANPPKQSGTR
ncbi:MAG: transposase [Actinomycetota bacterium]|jgi:transposase-like protein|nr:transposase [Actinomycetota bacterium]